MSINKIIKNRYINHSGGGNPEVSTDIKYTEIKETMYMIVDKIKHWNGSTSFIKFSALDLTNRDLPGMVNALKTMKKWNLDEGEPVSIKTIINILENLLNLNIPKACSSCNELNSIPTSISSEQNGSGSILIGGAEKADTLIEAFITQLPELQKRQRELTNSPTYLEPETESSKNIVPASKNIVPASKNIVPASKNLANTYAIIPASLDSKNENINVCVMDNEIDCLKNLDCNWENNKCIQSQCTDKNFKILENKINNGSICKTNNSELKDYFKMCHPDSQTIGKQTKKIKELGNTIDPAEITRRKNYLNNFSKSIPTFNDLKQELKNCSSSDSEMSANLKTKELTNDNSQDELMHEPLAIRSGNTHNKSEVLEEVHNNNHDPRNEKVVKEVHNNSQNNNEGVKEGEATEENTMKGVDTVQNSNIKSKNKHNSNDNMKNKVSNSQNNNEGVKEGSVSANNNMKTMKPAQNSNIKSKNKHNSNDNGKNKVSNSQKNNEGVKEGIVSENNNIKTVNHVHNSNIKSKTKNNLNNNGKKNKASNSQKTNQGFKEGLVSENNNLKVVNSVQNSNKKTKSKNNLNNRKKNNQGVKEGVLSENNNIKAVNPVQNSNKKTKTKNHPNKNGKKIKATNSQKNRDSLRDEIQSDTIKSNPMEITDKETTEKEITDKEIAQKGTVPEKPHHEKITQKGTVPEKPNHEKITQKGKVPEKPNHEKITQKEQMSKKRKSKKRNSKKRKIQISKKRKK